jgi:hypothetical protein
MINPLNQLIGKPFINTIVYYRNPKCASSSIYAALQGRNLFWREKKILEEKLRGDKKYQGLFDVSHVLPSESARIFGYRALENFFSFTCVRNPFDKQVSQWNFSRGKGFGKFYGVPDDGTFSDWCELLYKKRGDKNFWPTILQTEFSHFRPLKYILRFEKINEDWKNMIKEFDIKGISDTLPHENSTTHAPWQEYYGETERQIILEIFSRDFERLNYSQSIT